MCSMFRSELVSRLSTQTTRSPCASNWSQRWEPRNPAPPVTTAVGIGARCYPGALRAGRNAYEALTRSPARPASGAISGPSAQVLVRLHVEPHCKQGELRSEDQQECDEDDRSDRDRVAHDPQHDLRDAEPEADQRHEESERVEEHEWMEVADHVLLAHPPEE